MESSSLNVHFLQVDDADLNFNWEFVDVVDSEEDGNIIPMRSDSRVSSIISGSFSREFDSIDNEFDDVDEYYNADDYVSDLDEELIPCPWYVKPVFSAQRMIKLGKRPFSKMRYSKRYSYLFLKPGCIRCGKHGLGLRHIC